MRVNFRAISVVKSSRSFCHWLLFIGHHFGGGAGYSFLFQSLMSLGAIPLKGLNSILGRSSYLGQRLELALLWGSLLGEPTSDHSWLC